MLDRLEAYDLIDPILRADYMALFRARLSHSGFSDAVRVRRNLASDTMAPDWLREYAAETVEILR